MVTFHTDLEQRAVRIRYLKVSECAFYFFKRLFQDRFLIFNLFFVVFGVFEGLFSALAIIITT